MTYAIVCNDCGKEGLLDTQKLKPFQARIVGLLGQPTGALCPAEISSTETDWMPLWCQEDGGVTGF